MASSAIKRIMKSIEARMSGRYLKKNYPQVAEEIGQIMLATNMGYKNPKVPLWKNADLMRILERFQPDRICEFGSGTTTASFNAWIKKKSGRSGITFESHAEWHRVISENVDFSDNYDYVLSETHRHDRVAEFQKRPTDFKPDFVYVDGPPLDGQAEYNADFLWIIDNLPLPKQWVIDIRYKTVVEMYKVFKERGLGYRLYVSRDFPVALLGSDSRYGYSKDIRHSMFIAE